MISPKSRAWLRMYVNRRGSVWSGEIIYNWRLRSEERCEKHMSKNYYQLGPSEREFIKAVRFAVGRRWHEWDRPSSYASEKFARANLRARIS